MKPYDNFERVPSCRLANLVRYAWSETRRRPLPAAIALLAAFVPAANLWIVGGAGEQLYRAQRERLEATLPTEVTILPPPGAGDELRVTPLFLRELEDSPWVERAYPKVELQLRLAAGREQLVLAEGRVPGDPAHRPGRLVAGRSFESENAEEVIVTEDLFHRLDGRWTPHGCDPAQLALRAQRIVDGEVQELLLDLSVVGLLRDERGEDKLDLPLGLALALDAWFEGGELSACEEPDLVGRDIAAASWVRATVFARDLDSIEPLVEHLRRAHGFQTRDALAEQRALRELARMLTWLVVALVAGSFLVGAIASLGTQAQKVQAHVREIALLRSMGASTFQVLGIHGIEGLGLGAAAFLLALGTQSFAGPRVADALCSMLALERSVPGPTSLALACAVSVLCVGASLAGTLLPALWAARRSDPSKTLRS